MVTLSLRSRLMLPIAPLVAVAAALAVVAIVLGTPQALFERAVIATRLPAILPAASPPLGLTARLALMVTFGGAAASFAWFLTYGLIGDRRLALRLPRRPAPERAPLRATRDLGAPFLELPVKPREPVVRAIPKDLDMPLSAFDPAAIPDEPAVAVPLVTALARAPLSDGERIETFELPTPIAAPRTDATIKALLERLERGVANRPRPAPEVERLVAQAAGMHSALGELRRVALR